MTEQDYIKAKAQGTITAAIDALRDIAPENLTDVISEEEYRSVFSILIDWQQRLFEHIEIS